MKLKLTYRKHGIIQKLEKAIKRVITVGNTRNFFCDSHPWLCVNCIRIRMIIRRNYKNTYIIGVHTKRGVFLWCTMKRFRQWFYCTINAKGKIWLIPQFGA